jgi:hypothetical protein
MTRLDRMRIEDAAIVIAVGERADRRANGAGYPPRSWSSEIAVVVIKLQMW